MLNYYCFAEYNNNINNNNMEEKKQQNNYKFGLFLRNEKIVEQIFSADLYNPVVRYDVNIREMIPTIISSLQKTLQTPSQDLTFEEKFSDGDRTITYNALSYYIDICDINNLDYFKLKVPAQQRANPVGGRAYSQRNGTEFKFGLYINANTIVERNFYVDNYNPRARFSQELADEINRIVRSLKKHIKLNDEYHMWDDYKIIKTYMLNIQQVRKLSNEKRVEYLLKVGDELFVDSIKAAYNKLSEFAI